MKFRKANILLAGVALLALGGCNKMAPSADKTGASAAASGPATSAEQTAGKKLDTYVQAHNTFVGSFGFEEKARDYRSSNIAHASVNGPFLVDAGWIEQGMTKLKAAHAMSGGSAELDAAADALVGSMGKAQAHLASLETYYTSKKYLDDKLARGKAEDPQMLAELDAADKDFRSFGAQLDAALEKRDEALLGKLKGGDQLRYNTELALIHAKKLINLFHGPADAKKPELFAKGDAEVAIIEQALADAHQEAGKQGKSDPTGLSSLTTMIGSYRSLKQGHEVSDLSSMMEDYNQAVESSNMFGGLG